MEENKNLLLFLKKYYPYIIVIMIVDIVTIWTVNYLFSGGKLPSFLEDGIYRIGVVTMLIGMPILFCSIGRMGRYIYFLSVPVMGIAIGIIAVVFRIIPISMTEYINEYMILYPVYYFIFNIGYSSAKWKSIWGKLIGIVSAVILVVGFLYFAWATFMMMSHIRR